MELGKIKSCYQLENKGNWQDYTTRNNLSALSGIWCKSPLGKSGLLPDLPALIVIHKDSKSL